MGYDKKHIETAEINLTQKETENTLHISVSPPYLLSLGWIQIYNIIESIFRQYVVLYFKWQVSNVRW